MSILGYYAYCGFKTWLTHVFITEMKRRSVIFFGAVSCSEHLFPFFSSGEKRGGCIGFALVPRS